MSLPSSQKEEECIQSKGPISNYATGPNCRKPWPKFSTETSFTADFNQPNLSSGLFISPVDSSCLAAGSPHGDNMPESASRNTMAQSTTQQVSLGQHHHGLCHCTHVHTYINASVYSRSKSPFVDLDGTPSQVTICFALATCWTCYNSVPFPHTGVDNSVCSWSLHDVSNLLKPLPPSWSAWAIVAADSHVFFTFITF